MYDACYPLEEGEILNESHSEWPLFVLNIYGSKLESLKISKRIMCSLKHLPLRLQVFYNHDTLKAIEEGCGKDPCIKMNGKILFEGLIQAEDIRGIFEKILKGDKVIKFDDYLRSFDYNERKRMKIQIPEMLELFAKGECQIIDIRFKEEYKAWNISFIKNIPLNELPDRLDELDKNKTIVTVCPHYDRAEIARMFLTLKGYKARYLTDGLLKVVDFLRGDKARDYLKKIGQIQ